MERLFRLYVPLLATTLSLSLTGCDRSAEPPREAPSSVGPSAAAPAPEPSPPAPAATEATAVEDIDVVKSIDAGQGRITLAHEPISALSWPAMTMPFAVSSPALLQGLKEGQQVRFTLEGESTITAIEPLP
ncbi:MAG: copper-binding protein [Moraxellaceae bacterium]